MNKTGDGSISEEKFNKLIKWVVFKNWCRQIKTLYKSKEEDGGGMSFETGMKKFVTLKKFLLNLESELKDGNAPYFSRSNIDICLVDIIIFSELTTLTHMYSSQHCLDKDTFPLLYNWMAAMDQQECIKLVAS